MISELTPPPPRWLPPLIVGGSLLVAVVMAITAGKGASEVWAAAWGLWTVDGLFARCMHSGVILLVALALATSTGFCLQLAFGQRGRLFLEAGGAVLALFPITALTWGLVNAWIVQRGLPIETLMPLELPRGDPDSSIWLGRLLWKYLAPALMLTVPLLGAVCMTTRLPLRTRVLALCMQAPAWLIIIEDVLHFMGWGGWMAQSIRAGDALAAAAGVSASGWLLAGILLVLGLIPTRAKNSAPHFGTLSWLPWPLWVLCAGACGLSQTTSWVLMWLVLFGMSWPYWLAALRGLHSTRHAMHIAAWSLEVMSMLLIWVVAVASVHPQPLNGAVMRVFRPLVVTTHEQAASTLLHPESVLRLGGLLLAVALVLHAGSRFLRHWQPTVQKSTALPPPPESQKA